MASALKSYFFLVDLSHPSFYASKVPIGTNYPGTFCRIFQRTRKVSCNYGQEKSMISVKLDRTSHSNPARMKWLD